jgi:hypothetical protein
MAMGMEISVKGRRGRMVTPNIYDAFFSDIETFSLTPLHGVRRYEVLVWDRGAWGRMGYHGS